MSPRNAVLLTWLKLARETADDQSRFPEADRPWIRDMMRRQLEIVPSLLHAIESGSEAAVAGLLGMEVGAAISRLSGVWLEQALREEWDAIVRGRTTLEAAAKGGRERPRTLKGPSREQLARELKELRGAYPKLSEPALRKRVAALHGMHERTLRRRLGGR